MISKQVAVSVVSDLYIKTSNDPVRIMTFQLFNVFYVNLIECLNLFEINEVVPVFGPQ